MNERCETCRFSRISPNYETIEEAKECELDMQLAIAGLICHRFPPTAILIDGTDYCRRPEVFTDDWCGEYQPRKQDETR